MKRFLSGKMVVTMLFGVATVNVNASEDAAVVSTFAGTGSHGAADGMMAQFNLPASTLAAPNGVYVADTFNNLIRFIDWNGHVATVAGNIMGMDAQRFPVGLYRDGALNAALLNRPADMIMGIGGNIFVLDSANHALRIILQGGVFTFAGNGNAGHRDGNTVEALFNRPSAMAAGLDGAIYIADSGNHVIRRVDTMGNVTTVAGLAGAFGHRDGAANQALFSGPMGIAADSHGRIFVADTGNNLIRMIYEGEVTTLAGIMVFPHEIDPSITYFSDGWDHIPLGGFADGSYDEAMFNMPRGLALWQDILIVADTGNHRIRAILPDGEIITLAGSGLPGHDDGLPHAATFHLPQGVNVHDNMLYISDTGNNAIRTINLYNSVLHAAIYSY